MAHVLMTHRPGIQLVDWWLRQPKLNILILNLHLKNRKTVCLWTKFMSYLRRNNCVAWMCGLCHSVCLFVCQHTVVLKFLGCDFQNFQSFSPDIRNSKRCSLKPLWERTKVFRNVFREWLWTVWLCAVLCERGKERGKYSETSLSGIVHRAMIMNSFDKDTCWKQFVCIGIPKHGREAGIW